MERVNAWQVLQAMGQSKIHRFGRLRAIGAGALVLAFAGVPAMESIGLAANAVDFIEHQPDFEADPLFGETINYGDMSVTAKKGLSWNRVLFGDSLTWGYNSDGKQYCVAQMVAADVNRILAITGVPRPSAMADGDGQYWLNYIWAESGTKSDQVTKQIDAFASMMRAYPANLGPWTVEASMGGVDALRYLMDHLNWKRGRYTVSDFQRAFLPAFKLASKRNILALVNLRAIPALADLRFIELTGIPDIGQSKDLWVMEVPSIKAMASAATAYMNEGLIAVVKEARAETGFPIYLNNMFSLAMSDIHPSPSGYLAAADRREQRLIGQFPDGTRSFKEERLKHGIQMLESATLSSMVPPGLGH